MEEDVGIPLLKGERKEIGGGSLAWDVFWREVKVLGSIAGLLMAVSMSQYLLQIVCLMMVGHLGELSLASAALAISLCSVTDFSPSLVRTQEESVRFGALSFPSGARIRGLSGAEFGLHLCPTGFNLFCRSAMVLRFWLACSSSGISFGLSICADLTHGSEWAFLDIFP